MKDNKEWKFTIDENQVEQYKTWLTEHSKICKYRKAKTAIGGDKTFSFTPNSIGTTVKVKCVCGEEVDVSDYESW